MKNKSMNSKIQLLGLLPNMVENKPFQKENLKQIVDRFSKILLKLDDGEPGYIGNRIAFPESQASGKPIWKLGKVSADKVWISLKPIFEIITLKMEIA